MVYLKNWEEFSTAAEELYLASPEKVSFEIISSLKKDFDFYQTRYCCKYRPSESILIMKVTDNMKCLKFCADQLQDLKKLEKFNQKMMSLMLSRPPSQT
jgi:signal recognition particle subunit SRP9